MFHFHGPWAQENVAAGDSSRVRYCCARRSSGACCGARTPTWCCPRRFAGCSSSATGCAPGTCTCGLREWRSSGSRPASRGRARARARLGMERAGVRRRVRAAPGAPHGHRRTAGRVGADPAGAARGLDAAAGRRRAAARGAGSSAPTGGRWRAACACSVASPRRISSTAYRAADVAVVPSVSLEGFGLVVPEAAACGTPSIVSDVGGLPEVTLPLDRSLVVAPGDAAALGERGSRRRRAESCPTREATRSFAEALLLAGAGRAPPRAVPPSGGRRARRAAARRVSRSRRAPVRRRDRADAPAHPLGARQPARDPRRGRSARRPAVTGRASPSRSSRSPPPRAICAATRCAPAPPRRWRRCTRSTYVARLALRLRTLRPDLVHTNSLKAGVYGSLAARARRRAGRVARARPHRRGLHPGVRRCASCGRSSAIWPTASSRTPTPRCRRCRPPCAAS